MLKPHSRVSTKRVVQQSANIVAFACNYQWRRWNKTDAKSMGRWLKESFTDLGPAFIKMGQFLSTRPDVFDAALVKELSALQDDLEPVPFDVMEPFLNAQLGRPWQEVLDSLDTVPIASASIGQVYRGRLKQQDVVLKLQKPDVRESIQTDLVVLKGLCNGFGRLGFPQAQEFAQFVAQYDRFLSAELNFMNELENMETFRANIDDTFARVPRTLPSFCTEQLLVMEYVPSTKISNVEDLQTRGADTAMLAERLVELFLESIIVHGMVHCDPHPGNIGVAEDLETLVLYDFGNAIRLSPDFCKNVDNLVLAVYQKDADEFVQWLVRLKILVPTPGQGELDVVELRAFFAVFFEYLESLDVAQLKSSILTGDFSSNRSSASFQLDQDFLALFRVFSLLDGTCLRLDPDFNYLTVLAPFAQERWFTTDRFVERMQRDVQRFMDTPKRLGATDQTIARLQTRVATLQDGMLLACVSLAAMECVAEPYRAACWMPLAVWATMQKASKK